MGLMGIINGHFLDSYHFEHRTGQVVASPFQKFDLKLRLLQDEYHDLQSSGALTDADKIMLDAAAAMALTTAIRDGATESLDAIINKLHNAVSAQKSYWQKFKEQSMMAAPNLSSDEVMSCLNDNGANYHSIVGKYEQDANRRITKARTLRNKFTEWASKVQQGINEVIASDNQLAKEFHL
ncbi:hypothetical protein [Fructilactobacillus carniphilus]|uniref:Uncharacterized protein n=1 Tax=Fructilactobacillus carniphilus TaxID=2940297 RepID=A0ABY5BWE5_9LACO|nr:hypothetical protein [Fructilactobacillus carniphilus]USS90566.1 hypothetical protein M3M37_06960 [Fructilactobacillus carniphilus]